MKSSSSVGERIAQEAENGRESSSQSKCLTYVRTYVQKGLKIPVQSVGIEHAKDFGQYLLQVGFKNVAPGSYQNGDIVIFQDSYSSNGKYHASGHIQVYRNGRWISDFLQNDFSPYNDRHIPSYAVYRFGK